MVSFMLLTSAPSFQRSALRVLPRGHLQWRGEEYLRDVNSALAGYVRAQTAAGLLVGLVLAGNLTPAPAVSAEPRPAVAPRLTAAPRPKEPVGLPPSFAEIAARVNPAVVTVNSSAAGDPRSDRRGPVCRPTSGYATGYTETTPASANRCSFMSAKNPFRRNLVQSSSYSFSVSQCMPCRSSSGDISAGW